MNAVRGLFVVALAGLFLALPAGAGPAGGALPEALARALKGNPARFEETAGLIILGHGDARGIDRAGLERVVAIGQARRRASALRRIVQADLDGDDQVTEDELRAVAAAMSARSRGRILRDFAGADVDGNGILSRPEMQDFAQAEAQRLGETQAEELLALMYFDSDGDGFVTVAELRGGIERAGAGKSDTAA